MNITIKKVVNSVFKNNQYFFTTIGSYRDTLVKLVYFLPIFGLQSCGHVPGRPQTLYVLE